MSLNINQPLALHERIEVLDVLRGFAVGGILLVNIQYFSGYGLMPATLAHQSGTLDQITRFLIYFLVQGKFYSIFSFLFGFGFAMQVARAEERGDFKANTFKRRLFWLLIIGLFHACLLSPGDILSIYAVTGFALILFLRKSNCFLLKWAFALNAMPILTYSLVYIAFVLFAPPDAALRPNIENQIAGWNEIVNTVSNGNFWQILNYNLQSLGFRCMGLLYEMRLPKILAMFLIGFYAYRRGYFNNTAAHVSFIRNVLPWAIVLGIAGNLLFAILMLMGAFVPPSLLGIVSTVAYAVGVPAFAFCYISVITLLWQKAAWQSLLRLLAPVGRMALSNYLLQSFICIFIFYSYGFGLFGKVGAVRAAMIALAIYLFQIIASAWWLKHFDLGPMEWIWRRLIYRQPTAFHFYLRQKEKY